MSENEGSRGRILGVLFSLAVVATVAVIFPAGPDRSQPRGKGKQQARGVACGAERPLGRPRSYPSPLPFRLQPETDYKAVVETSCGELVIDLLEEQAPVAVNNFVFLADEGFFKGLPFFRIERNFVIATGDPNGRPLDNPDGPGYTIPDELWARPSDYTGGAVAMASPGPAEAGSQWFVVVHDLAEQLPAGIPASYTLFGRIEQASYPVLDRLRKLPTRPSAPDPRDQVRPLQIPYIEDVRVETSPS